MIATQKNIKKLIEALEEFKKIDPAMSLPSILTFLYYHDVYNRSGNRSIVEERLNMSGATASRATLYWSKFKTPRVKGVDMLELNQDPENRRANIVTYNTKGMELLDRLNRALN